MSIKSIPLKTWEVQATLDNRKSTLRRVVKMDRHSIYKAACAAGRWSETFAGEIPDEVAEWYAREVAKPPYHPGDILWVRETFFRDECSLFCAGWDDPDECPFNRVGSYCYGYRTQYGDDTGEIKWHPSIHMPREAARLFLRVKSVRVERLQEITPEQCAKEGLTETQKSVLNEDEYWYWFMNLWNSTIKPADLPRCGWDTNPWVFVVEFERREKPEVKRLEETGNDKRTD